MVKGGQQRAYHFKIFAQLGQEIGGNMMGQRRVIEPADLD